MLGALLTNAEGLGTPHHLPTPGVLAPPPPQGPVPSQLSDRLVKITPDDEMNPGEQRQAVALTHVDFGGHHWAQSVGAETEGTKTTVRGFKKWREPDTS